MASIESQERWESYKEIFSELWESATVRVSLVEVGDYKIPNGEIIFHRDSQEPDATTCYSIEDFEIIEETVSNHYTVIDRLFDSELLIDNDSINLEFHHLRNTNDHFQGRASDSRVFDERPIYGELQTIFKPEIPDEFGDEYDAIVDEIGEQLKTAEEPYFDLNKCEFYYFDHHFRGLSSYDPMVLVLADTGIRFNVDAENELILQFPMTLADEMTIIAYPQRPYGEHQGWKTPMSEVDLEERSNGLATYTESLDLGEIEELYFQVYVGDEVMAHERHNNSEFESANDKYRILEKYDRGERFPDFLAGEDPNQFEMAVLNLLSLSGYIVQYFGEDLPSIPYFDPETNEPEYEDIDLIAHAPDGSHIAFVECTNRRISEKRDILDRVEQLTSGILEEPETDIGRVAEEMKTKVICIATPQSPEELSDEVVEDFERMGVVVLDSEKLENIYRMAKDLDELVEIDGDHGLWLDEWTV